MERKTVTIGNLTCYGLYYPGYKGRHTEANGDPGTPGAIADFVITTITIGDQVLTEDNIKDMGINQRRLEEQCLEKINAEMEE